MGRIAASRVRTSGIAIGTGALAAVPAVANSAALRPARSARSSTLAAVCIRCCQAGAEAQPLSITSSTGPLPGSAAPASSTGRARPIITSAAVRTRKASSHQGVRAGVSSAARRPSSRRKAGKDSVRGAGGVTRSNHHSIGSPAKAASTQGAAKIMCVPTRNRATAARPRANGRSGARQSRIRRRCRARPARPAAPARPGHNRRGWPQPGE